MTNDTPTQQKGARRPAVRLPSVSPSLRAKLFAAVSLVLAIVYLSEARGLRLGDLERPGPAAWPMLLGALLVLASGFLFFERIITGTSEPASEPGPETDAPSDASDETAVEDREGSATTSAAPVLTGVAAFLLYGLLLSLLGHLLAGALLGTLIARAYGELSWLKALLVGCATSLAIFGLIAGVLGVRLPAGILG